MLQEPTGWDAGLRESVTPAADEQSDRSHDRPRAGTETLTSGDNSRDHGALPIRLSFARQYSSRDSALRKDFDPLDCRHEMSTDTSTWAIDARGLTKTFGTVTAVRGVTLQVPSGMIFAFLGPNGSGKSTTVKLLTGLLAPTAGEARVTGRVVSVEDLELRREIGILPED